MESRLSTHAGTDGRIAAHKPVLNLTSADRLRGARDPRNSRGQGLKGSISRVLPNLLNATSLHCGDVTLCWI